MTFKSTRASRRLKNNRSEDQKQRQPFFSKASDTVQTKQENAFFQPKLTIGQPNDKYEKEADAVADSVVNKTNQQPAVQQKKISSIQRTTLATPMEDEKLGTAEERMRRDKLIQEKPEVQKMDDKEEEEVQMKSETCGGNTASSQLSQKISSKAGSGQKLSPKVRAEMESGIGADFRGVNIHTDSDAVQMNKELGAQAFTHGNDVFFNKGKYDGDSSGGKRLLAHELTHVVQQKSNSSINKKIQRYGGCTSSQNAIISSDHFRALGMLDVAIRKLRSYNGTTPTEINSALNTHFAGSTSSAFGSWIQFNLNFLRSSATLPEYQCETVGNSMWACTSPNAVATAFWCVPGFDIRLCPTYFGQSDIERSTNLIHEWVHKYGCNFDLGYEHDSGYSSNSTLTQLINADSFANFVRDVQ